MAGDVYTHEPRVGQGGWSWYTGAAAWMHRAALESIFGLRLGAQDLELRPCLPAHWPSAELTLVRDGRSLRFLLSRGSQADAAQAAAAIGARCCSPVRCWALDRRSPPTAVSSCRSVR
jgi:cyclic beta-1,2-glucan synthetase